MSGCQTCINRAYMMFRNFAPVVRLFLNISLLRITLIGNLHVPRTKPIDRQRAAGSLSRDVALRGLSSMFDIQHHLCQLRTSL